MSDHLEFAVVWWLHYLKRCQIVLQERTPRHHFCYSRPDVIGVTPARFLLEVECKRTLSDFKADSGKVHVANREHCVKRWPKWFYYAVPDAIAERVLPLLPAWAGLMRVDYMTVRVERPAPRNDDSPRLSVRECCHLTKLLGSQIISQHTSMETFRGHWEAFEWGIDYHI